jgi:tetratricopeptide (TPR) repeat protein
MDKSSRRRLQFTVLAILLCAVFCLGPMLRDLGSRNYPDEKELAGQESKRRGLEAMKQRNWPLAITHFEEAIGSYEELIEEVLDKTALRGSYANRQFRHEALMRSLDGVKTAHGLKNEITEIHFNRGIAYKEVSEYQKAIDDFSMVIQWTSRPTAYQLRAEAYRALGKHAAAEKDEEMVSMLRADKSG